MIGIIPAAGKGTRLKPITEAIPKELLHCGSKCLIEHALESLKLCGIKRACIITGHKKGPLIDFVKDGSHYGLDVDFAYQTTPSGLGHAILCSKNKIRNDNLDLMVLLGDTVIEPKSILIELKDTHKKEAPLATFLLKEVEDPARWGVVRLKDFNNGKGEIQEVFEKPETTEEQKRFEIDGKYYAIIGVYCLNQRIFSYLEKTPKGRNNEIQLTDAIELGLKNGEKAIGIKFEGTWLDVGAPKTYLLAQWEFFRNKTEKEIHELAEEWDRSAERLNSENSE
ncbi:MAG: nucleotidyltransferase family protein [archaeon]